MPEDQQQQWTKQIQDVLADNSKLRENLTDDIALPFVEWGRDLAAHMATQLAAPDTPPPNEEQVNEAGYNLGRLMTRINWLVTYRTQKDADWLARTFAMVNKLSQDVHGDNAPTLSDDEIAAWLADQPNHTDDELLRDLMTRYTPAALHAASESAPTDAGAPPSPLSNAAFGESAPAAATPSPLSNAAFGESAPADSNASPAAAGEPEPTVTPPTPLSNTMFDQPTHLSDAIFGSSHTPGEDEHDEEEHE